MSVRPILHQTKEIVLSTIWQLPYDLRRNLYKSFYARDYRALESIRFAPQTEDYGLDAFDVHQCIFIHIPKCAGVSISRALFGKLVGTHTAIKTFQLIYTQEEFNRYFKFAIVRNPWDRLLSAYLFLKKGGLTTEDRVWAEEHIAHFTDFNQFVKEWVNYANVNSWQHFKPQHRFLLDPAGNLPLDYLGYFETLQTDFETIAQRLNIDATLSHQNKSRTPKNPLDYKNYYDPESAEIVASIYRKDIELLGYDFELGRIPSNSKSMTA